MSPQSVPYYSGEVLEKLRITTLEVADLIEQLIRDRAEGNVWSAPKAAISVPDGRYAMSTMAVADDPGYLVVKSLLLNPRNPDSGQPLMNSIVSLQDGETGVPLAILDGNWITAVRTAALSVVAARRMARPQSQTIAFIGCGLQARSHLTAMMEAFPLTAVRAFGRGRPNLDALGTMAAELGLAFHEAPTAADAMHGADLIVSSLTRLAEAEPFIDADEVGAGAFAALVDLGRPWLPATLKRFDTIFIDDKVQEAGMKDQMVPAEQVSGDLTDLVLDPADLRTPKDRRAAFVFRGYALGDFALAALAYDTLRRGDAAG